MGLLLLIILGIIIFAALFGGGWGYGNYHWGGYRRPHNFWRPRGFFGWGHRPPPPHSPMGRGPGPHRGPRGRGGPHH